ncbi:MAG: aminoglycoside phosphotransferase family protein [Proteobacteria bacterium]|nr:aminoglycoside phosphotransferase family protein [Pseudomonadota bacterium]
MPRDDFPGDEARIESLVVVPPGELAELVGGDPIEVMRVDGGLTNTIHRVTLAGGASFAVKHYAGGVAPFRDELTTLRQLHGVLPVPEVVRADDRRHAIVYRWVEGITLDECRRTQPAAVFASLAEPLGRLLAWMARTDAPGSWALAPIVERAHALLTDGRPRERLGAPVSDALRRAYDAVGDNLAWGPLCLSHGDFGSRNLIVQQADGDRWRIAGVIDWETMAAGAPLVDIGALFRYGMRYDAPFRADFARGYREAGREGEILPDDWFVWARMLDATWLVETLDEDRELPGVFADCKKLIGRLVAELAR